MADYPPYRPSQLDAQYGAHHSNNLDPLRRSYTHNSHYSHNTASTRSWVQQNVHQNPPPPAEEYDIEQTMSPIRTPRPLPQPQMRPNTFYTVQASDRPEEEEEEYMSIDPDVSGHYDYQTFGLVPSRRIFTSPDPALTPSSGPPPKERSFVGGFVRGLRKLPKRMMGYGVSNEKGRFFRRGTPGTEASATTAGMATGNTLPLYRSNPTTPVAGPSNVQYVQDLQMAFAPNNPVPEVVRASPSEERQSIPHSLLSGAALRRVTPTFHVTPPSDSVSHESHAQIYQSRQPQPVQVMDPDPVANNAERTTVMVYSESADHHSSMPPTEQQAPILSRVPSRTPRTSGATARVPSVTIHAPLARPPSPHPPQPLPDPMVQELDMVQSPATEHPPPTADYRKMPHFPTSPSRNTMTMTGTSWYGQSYASELTPIERFFKTLYNLPWVSHGRVTIDYRPAAGLEGKLKTKGLTKKPMASWYRRFSRSSRNAELDLLSSGTAGTTPRTSLGTSFLSSIPSPPRSNRTKRSGGTSSSARQHRTQHRSHTHHRKRHRHRRRSMSTIEEPERGESPMLPAMYPYAYPAYPFTYPGYAAMPPALAQGGVASPPMSPPGGSPNQMQLQQMAAMQHIHMPVPVPAPVRRGTGESGGHSKRSPRGPRSRSTRKPTYPGGYAPYQTMAYPPPPPPIYVQQQQQQGSPTGTNGMVVGEQGQILQQVYIPMQVVPGAYNPGPRELHMHDSTMSSIPSPPSSPTPRPGSVAPAGGSGTKAS